MFVFTLLALKAASVFCSSLLPTTLPSPRRPLDYALGEDAAVWPQMGFDQRHAGMSPFAGPGTATVRTVWEFKTGASIYSTPVIDGNRTVFIGSTDASIYAVSSATGGSLWSYKADSAIVGTPALDGSGAIFFNSLLTVYALDASTGRLKWTFANSGGQLSSSSLVATGTVLYSTTNQTLTALNSTNGGLLWQYPVSLFASAAVGPSGNIVAGSNSDGRLLSLFSNGSVFWSQALGPMWGTPTVGEDGAIYIATSSRVLYALSFTGVQLWTFSSTKCSRGIPKTSVALGANNTLLFTCISYVFCLDRVSGRELWNYTLYSGTLDVLGGSLSSPTVGSDGVVYLMIESFLSFADIRVSEVYALDGGSGYSLWTLNVNKKMGKPTSTVSSVVINNDLKVIVGCMDGSLYAISGGFSYTPSPAPTRSNRPPLFPSPPPSPSPSTDSSTSQFSVVFTVVLPVFGAAATIFAFACGFRHKSLPVPSPRAAGEKTALLQPQTQ